MSHHVTCSAAMLFLFISVSLQVYAVAAFQTVSLQLPVGINRYNECRMSRSFNKYQTCRITLSLAQFASDADGATDADDSSDADLFNEITNNNGSYSTNDTAAQAQDQILSELQWRSKKISLEEAESERFKKRIRSKPWKLPIEESRKWVNANFGVNTKEEFMDLVMNGNLRTPYVPKDPERYYSDQGTWISWRHFLCQEEEC